ncbi:chemotaxis protein [Bdellovibrio bacteriovorus]|uniref:Chemotaxis protein n=1 Tax=Bdellovibrio bacteriovorus TaxID=959 RepID=A0A162H125_BDEBC|nr:chemotaxis protein CheW [Bdellovibrio bacteriovorus]KYG69409.1 chemotaxis protein [Bdellovibrio bacteriovorus]
MSDFFSDDFTAELKAYFLDSVCKEADKFIDLTDESTLRRIRNEVGEQTRAWAVDAKTNEFVHFSQWLELFEERTQSFKEPRELIKSLKTLKAYAEALIQEKADTADHPVRFALSAELRQDVQLLHCRWGNQDFAIPLLNVVEISSQIPLYPLPDKKDGLMGVIPFRGEAVPVISFHDHGFNHSEIKNTFYVICEHQGVRFSLQVTETDDLMSLKESELLNVESHSTVIQTAFVSKFFIKGNKSIMILDLEKLVA